MSYSVREPAPPARLAWKTACVCLLAAGASCASSSGGTDGALSALMTGSARPGQSATRFVDLGLSLPEAALRQFIAARDTVHVSQAIAALPNDTLLRLLNWGLARHRMGQFAASNVALEAADHIAEDRYTKSISQNVGISQVDPAPAGIHAGTWFVPVSFGVKF